MDRAIPRREFALRSGPAPAGSPATERKPERRRPCIYPDLPGVAAAPPEAAGASAWPVASHG